MKKNLIITALVLITLAWSFDALAQGGKGCRNRGMGWCWNAPAGVNLTQEQIKNLDALRSSYGKETAALFKQLDKKELEMSMVLLESAPDADKATNLQKEISALQAKLADHQLAYQLKARAVFSAEQLAHLPQGCTMGFGNMYNRTSSGYGCGKGRGGRGYGMGCW